MFRGICQTGANAVYSFCIRQKPSKAVEHEKAHNAAASGGGQHAVRYVFRRGEPDLSRLHGSAGGQQRVAGQRRPAHHRRGAAAAGCGRPGREPGERPAGTEQPGGPPLRPVLHLCFVSHHRAAVRHPPLRHRLLHGGRAAAATGGGPAGGAGAVLSVVLRCGALFLPAAGRAAHLDWQGAQPAVPVLSGGAGGAGAPFASRRGERGGPRGRL